jgi:hypothetical protein
MRYMLIHCVDESAWRTIEVRPIAGEHCEDFG